MFVYPRTDNAQIDVGLRVESDESPSWGCSLCILIGVLQIYIQYIRMSHVQHVRDASVTHVLSHIQQYATRITCTVVLLIALSIDNVVTTYQHACQHSRQPTSRPSHPSSAALQKKPSGIICFPQGEEKVQNDAWR